MITVSTIQSIIDALKAGQTPEVSPEDVPCFSAEALEGNPVLTPAHLQHVLAALTADDVPALERALASLRLNDQAWLGFKVVLDAGLCCSTDPVSPEFGPSQDGRSTVFFANEGKQIVCSRPWNKRDRKQMLDCTRGPSMHTDQFQGVTWCSVPLFTTNRVVVYGAGEVSAFLTRYAADCGFTSLVVDDDPGFLTAERFPASELVQVKGDWSNLSSQLRPGTDDYCVVATRGHVHDVDAVVNAVQSEAFYVGMMGNPGKNADVFERCRARGCTPEALDAVYAPIGVKIADKTAPEIAISIVAELVDVRGRARKETAARVAQELGA